MQRNFRWLIISLWLPLGVAQANVQTDYAYAFPLDTHAHSDAYRVVLTPAVYAALNPAADLRDMVVVDSMGMTVPFGEMPVDPPLAHAFRLETRMLPVPASRKDGTSGVRVQRNANGDIVIDPTAAALTRPTQWLIDAGRAVSMSRINLVPESLGQDFQLRVNVEASNDLQQWETRAGDVSLTRVKDNDNGVEQLSIDLESAPARYFRLTLADGDVDWSAGHAPTVRLQGSYTDPASDALAKLQWQPIAGSASQDGKNFDYRLAVALPVQAITLTLPRANMAAHVTVLASRDTGDQSAWEPLGALDLVRVGNAEASATLHWPVHTIQQLRVHVDTTLAQAPTLQAGWQPAAFMFMAEGHTPYRLLAGSYAARRGGYPIEESLSKLRAAASSETWLPPDAALGPRSDAGGPAALLAPKVPYDWTRPVLWAVLVLGALLVAGMAWSLLKQSRRDQAKY